MPANSTLGSDSLYVHAARDFHPDTLGVALPLNLSTTFERNADGSIAEYLYSRYSNPNRDSFEQAMAVLEGGSHAFAFASGLAATMAILQSLKSGDHVLIPDDAYYGLRSQLMEIFADVGVSFSVVDFTDLKAVKTAITDSTKLVWIESPSNPSLKICDLASISALAHDRHARVVCDNTWATPVLQHPIALGCDVVLHSATKYIGGHSDVLLGVVVVQHDDDFAHRLKRIQMIGGAVPSPFECWLAARGLQTLPTRVRAACHSANVIAHHFEHHPLIEKVLFPGLGTHSGHRLAEQQMELPGAMLSILIRGTEQQALAVASATSIFCHATSLGSVESLIEHRASVEPPDSLTARNLLRLSVGLESVADLIADLEQALRTVFPD